MRKIVAVVVTLAALMAAVRLVAPQGGTAGVRRQMAFLRAELDHGAAEEAQKNYPEGYFFLYTLYGLTQVDLGNVKEARWALAQVETPAGRAPFDASLTPAYGVFYQGWTNWLRGGILSRQPDPSVRAELEKSSAALAAAFDGASTPYLPAFPGQAWPVDSTVAIASLRLHDKLLPPRYTATVARWLSGVRSRLDPATGLIPHLVDPVTGAPASVARGTSQSLIERFLVDIDPVFARSQYQIFRTRFLVRPLRLGPGVREFPSGADGAGDVDSGPLVLGTSLSATVVTIGAARVQGDAELAGALMNYGELLGVPVSTPGSKRYAGGLVPAGDAFVAWSKTARPWVGPQPAPVGGFSPWWRIPLLAALCLIVLLAWLSTLRRFGHRRQK